MLSNLGLGRHHRLGLADCGEGFSHTIKFYDALKQILLPLTEFITDLNESDKLSLDSDPHADQHLQLQTPDILNQLLGRHDVIKSAYSLINMRKKNFQLNV
jgi:hypothetical protein